MHRKDKKRKECLISYKIKVNNEYILLVSIYFILLTVTFTPYLIASLDKFLMYITSKGGDMHLNSLISKRLEDLDVTKKTVSLEAHKDFSKRNLL